MLLLAARSLARSVRRAEWLTTPAANPHTFRRAISCFPVALDKESDSEAAEAGSVLVDPSKDASLQDLFIIPIRKPLIPGVPILPTYNITCTQNPFLLAVLGLSLGYRLG